MGHTCAFVNQWWHLFLVACLILSPRVTHARLDLTRTYLFRDLPNGESAEPIIEHYDDTMQNNANNNNVAMPEFLQAAAPYHRVILFYSPQCPHCIHFQPTFIEFVRHFRNLTQEDTIFTGIDVKFFAMSCITYKKICQQQKITTFPQLKAFHANEKHEYILSSSDLHPMTVMKALGLTVINDNWGGTNSGGDTFQEQKLQPKTHNTAAVGGHYFNNTRSQAELYGDAYLTFYNAMKDSVFLEQGPLPKIRRQALRQFLVLLQKTLPPWRLNWLVKELLDDFVENTDTEDMWTSVLETFPPPQRQWSPACQQHESPYTCGLWTLLHIMTVGVVEYNRQIQESQLVNKAKFTVLSLPTAALMVREYIHHFFLCEECSTHFVQAFDACEYNRCQRLKDDHTSLVEWQELPLWLLDFHNGVNHRLQIERFQAQGREQTAATIEEQEAVLWPPAKDCPNCWIHPLHGASSAYNSSMMYRYIRLIYW
jgi:thiol-disulfide isomerase/thioredoxin